jgi:mannose-1-phosphate guanylyltransferase
MAGSTFAVIMAGGSGTRFWPASRTLRPKQLLPLVGDAEGEDDPSRASLLAATVARIAPLVPPERILVVTAKALVEATRRAVPELPAENVLAEPAPRNTAPCIGWATRTVLARDPEARVLVLPSDHHVADTQGFRDTISRALDAADHAPLATIGIKPTRPDTGFGYIETGAPLEGLAAASGGHVVARFVEKPDLVRAREFLAAGNFLWNSGMFFFRAKEMDASIRAYLPELADGLDRMGQGANAPKLDEIFPTLPSISVDYGVVEPLAKEAASGRRGRIAVVSGDFGWSDVGSWESAWELSPKDQDGNAAPAGTVLVDARGNLVRATAGKTVALIGVDELVVVETDDAILVMPRSRAQDVRAVVDALKATGRAAKLT